MRWTFLEVIPSKSSKCHLTCVCFKPPLLLSGLTKMGVPRTWYEHDLKISRSHFLFNDSYTVCWNQQQSTYKIWKVPGNNTEKKKTQFVSAYLHVEKSTPGPVKRMICAGEAPALKKWQRFKWAFGSAGETAAEPPTYFKRLLVWRKFVSVSVVSGTDVTRIQWMKY